MRDKRTPKDVCGEATSSGFEGFWSGAQSHGLIKGHKTWSVPNKKSTPYQVFDPF